jgi:hypothetical protein
MKNDPTPARPLPARAAQIAADARAALARVTSGGAKLPVWPTGQLIEIAPGVKVVPLADAEQARILVLDLEPQANGSYRPVARVRGKRVRLTREGLPALGISAGYKTLRRLIAAGFVRGEQPAPGVIQMDLESYFEHERATAGRLLGRPAMPPVAALGPTARREPAPPQYVERWIGRAPAGPGSRAARAGRDG